MQIIEPKNKKLVRFVSLIALSGFVFCVLFYGFLYGLNYVLVEKKIYESAIKEQKKGMERVKDDLTRVIDAWEVRLSELEKEVKDLKSMQSREHVLKLNYPLQNCLKACAEGMINKVDEMRCASSCDERIDMFIDFSSYSSHRKPYIFLLEK